MPAFLWVFFGGLFAHTTHDFCSLVLSVRHEGRFITDLAGLIVDQRLRVSSLLLVNISCLLLGAKCLEVIATVFILSPETVLPMLMEIPLGMGLVCLPRRLGSSSSQLVTEVLSLAVLVLFYVVLFVAVQIEDTGSGDPKFGVPKMCKDWVVRNNFAEESDCGFGQKQFWTLVLCVHAVLASCLPDSLWLQPRSSVNRYQFTAVMVPLALALITVPAFRADEFRANGTNDVQTRGTWFPALVTLMGGGVTSGLHGLVTQSTSCRLDRMRDARVVSSCGVMGKCMIAVLVVLVVCSSSGRVRNGVDMDGVPHSGR